MLEALVNCDVFKGELEWTPLHAPIGFNVACPLHNMRRLELSGGRTVMTELFNLELHQSVQMGNRNKSVVTFSTNVTGSHDPTGQVGITIIRPSNTLKPRVVMWCMINYDDN
eukprot:2014936-Prymnesium_polylepis.1